MQKIFEAIENDNFSDLKNEIDSNKLSLSELDSDGWTPLNLAIQYQMNDFAEYILSQLTPEQLNSQKPYHPLALAIEQNNKDAFELLLNSENTDIHSKNKANENLLFNAFYSSDPSYFKELLAKGVDPYASNTNGTSAFSLAIQSNKNDLLKELADPIALGENYNEFFIKQAIKYQNNEAFDILFPYSSLEKDDLFDLASGFNNIYAISTIIDSGGFMPGFEQIRSMTELMCTKQEKEEDRKATSNVIDYLFSIDVPFNKFVNKSGQSAWMLAIENDNMEVFSKLVRTNESVNMTDAESHSPLMYAIEHNKVEFVSLLLKKKANPNHVDMYKNTPLIKAVKKGNREIVKELLKYPTHINEINKNNESALNLAVKYKRMDIVSDLIWSGAEIVNNPAQFSEEQNVFHFNAQGQYEKLLTYHDEKNIDNFVALSQLGFNLNQTNDEGENFLIHFIKNGFLANFKALMRCSLDPNQPDANNNSPLMCAMNKNSPAYVEGLLARFNGIDMNMKNHDGENVYDLCLKHKRSDNRMSALIHYDDKITKDNATKAIFFLAQNGHLEENWDKLQHVIKNPNIKDGFGNSLLMLCIAGDNKKDYDFLLKNNYISNLKEKNNNNQTIYQLLEELPSETKQEYKQSLLYFSHINDEQTSKKPR
jgi:ankyrin repeat protein